MHLDGYDAAARRRPASSLTLGPPWTGPPSTSCASTRSARSRWTRSRRPTRAIPGRRWRSRRSPTSSTRASCEHAPPTPGLARPRPLRALGGPRLDAPLLDAAPHGLRRLARRPQELPPARLARPPATPSTATRRGSRRPPARSARASPPRSAWRSASACSPRGFNRARPRDRRPPHLRDRLRRRHAGGRRVRGLLARRPPRPRPADRLLRRQPHLDRGRHRAVVLRGRRRALRGLRLARAEPRRGPRPRRHRGGDARPRRPTSARR